MRFWPPAGVERWAGRHSDQALPGPTGPVKVRAWGRAVTWRYAILRQGGPGICQPGQEPSAWWGCGSAPPEIYLQGELALCQIMDIMSDPIYSHKEFNLIFYLDLARRSYQHLKMSQTHP
jgi:hypothetical protein